MNIADKDTSGSKDGQAETQQDISDSLWEDIPKSKSQVRFTTCRNKRLCVTKNDSSDGKFIFTDMGLMCPHRILKRLCGECHMPTKIEVEPSVIQAEQET